MDTQILTRFRGLVSAVFLLVPVLAGCEQSHISGSDPRSGQESAGSALPTVVDVRGVARIGQSRVMRGSTLFPGRKSATYNASVMAIAQPGVVAIEQSPFTEVIWLEVAPGIVQLQLSKGRMVAAVQPGTTLVLKTEYVEVTAQTEEGPTVLYFDTELIDPFLSVYRGTAWVQPRTGGTGMHVQGDYSFAVTADRLSGQLFHKPSSAYYEVRDAERVLGLSAVQERQPR